MQNSFIPTVPQLLLLTLGTLTFSHIRIILLMLFPTLYNQFSGSEGCWCSKWGSSEHFDPSELHSPTVDSWNQTQHFPSLYILQGPQLHQRICLLSLNLSLSSQKPKNLPPNDRMVFSQLCSLKTLIKKNINQNPDCREGHFSLTLRASSEKVFWHYYRQKVSGVSKKKKKKRIK